MMDILKSAIKCTECSSYFNKPVILPCGTSVCCKHLKDLQNGTFSCKHCNKSHHIEEGNVIVNKALDSLIKGNLENLDLGAEYAAFKRCNALDQTICEIETIKNDANCFIKQAIDKFRNKTKLIRDEHKLKIEQKANEIIEQLDNYEKECKDNIKSNDFKTKIAQMFDQNVNKMREDLFEWKKALNDAGSDEDQFKKIKKTSDESNLKLKSGSCDFKKELFVHKLNNYFSCVLNFQEIQLKSETKLKEEFEQFFDLLTDKTILDSKIIDRNGVQKLLELCKFPSDVKSKLIYRASEHGFTAKDFHSKCDNVPNTLTVIKSTSGYIFGGFTSQAWDKTNTYKCDPNAFLFSYVNPDYYVKKKLKIKDSLNAIYCGAMCGPTFGKGPDLQIFNNSNSSSNLDYTYEKANNSSYLTESNYFSLIDIEIFQIFFQ